MTARAQRRADRCRVYRLSGRSPTQGPQHVPCHAVRPPENRIHACSQRHACRVAVAANKAQPTPTLTPASGGESDGQMEAFCSPVHPANRFILRFVNSCRVWHRASSGSTDFPSVLQPSRLIFPAPRARIFDELSGQVWRSIGEHNAAIPRS